MVLEHTFWFSRNDLVHQWLRVLRFQEGRELVLFNNQREERLYKITQIGKDAVELELVTELESRAPRREVYLCFSVLKKYKNYWVFQKGTELGVRHFVPLLTERTEKTGFSLERARKIVVEAAEQCGRADIPQVREPLRLDTALRELNTAQICIAEQGGRSLCAEDLSQQVAVFVGPEGGWTDAEKRLFAERKATHIGLSDFTLRAETAAIMSAGLVLSFGFSEKP